MFTDMHEARASRRLNFIGLIWAINETTII